MRHAPSSAPSGSRRRPGRRREQIAAQPRPPPRRRSSCTSAPRMRAPEAPIGWPRATAPPLTLTLSSSMPSIRIELQRHRGEGLVDLPQVDVARLTGRPCRAPSRPRCAGVRGQVGEVVGRLRVGDDLGQRPPCRWPRPTRRWTSTSAPPPSLTPGELPAVCEPSLPTRPGSLASVSSVVSRRGPSSTSTTVSPLRPLTVTGDDLLGQAALVGRGHRALVRAQRPAVEVGARELELVADLGRLVEHLAAAERVGAGRRGPSRRAPWRRPCGSRSAPAGSR